MFRGSKLRKILSLFKEPAHCFSTGGAPKFVPKNNAGKIIGGCVLASVAFGAVAYKQFAGQPDEYYNEEELGKRGIFVEDQKILSQNKGILDAQLSLSVKPWELETTQKEKISSSGLKERYYFLLLGHNQVMIDRTTRIFQGIHAQVHAKYHQAPELSSYENDIIKPILITVDSANVPLERVDNTLVLQGNQQVINRAFGELLKKDYSDRLFIVDGINGSTVSLKIKAAENNSTNVEQLAAIFILNYLNEASVFRKFLA